MTAGQLSQLPSPRHQPPFPPPSSPLRWRKCLPRGRHPQPRHGAAVRETRAPGKQERNAGCPQPRSSGEPCGGEGGRTEPRPKSPTAAGGVGRRAAAPGEEPRNHPPHDRSRRRPRRCPAGARSRPADCCGALAVTYRPQRAAGQRRAAHGSAARYVPMAGSPAPTRSRPSRAQPRPEQRGAKRPRLPLPASGSGGKREGGEREAARPAAAPRPPAHTECRPEFGLKTERDKLKKKKTNQQTNKPNRWCVSRG